MTRGAGDFCRKSIRHKGLRQVSDTHSKSRAKKICLFLEHTPQMVDVAKCYTSGVSWPKSLTQNATQCSKMLRSKRGLKKCHSVFPEKNTQKNIFRFGMEDALYRDMENKVSQVERKKMNPVRIVRLTTLTTIAVRDNRVIGVQFGKIVSKNPTDIKNAQIAYDESR